MAENSEKTIKEMNGFELEQKAKEGDVDAMEEYGSRRLRGVGGVGRDVGDALQWLTKAAEKGGAMAKFYLAGMYESGTGVEEDEAKAAQLCQEAAESGLALAQHYLARCWASGSLGLKKDMHQAMMWMKNAAEGDHVASQFQYATLLMREIAQGKDSDGSLQKEAEMWFSKVSRCKGHKMRGDALCCLAEFHRKSSPPEMEAAYQCYLVAAEEIHHPLAMLNLGGALYGGEGCKKDPEQGKRRIWSGKEIVTGALWTQRASEKGNVEAQWRMCQAHLRGLGVKKDGTRSAAYCQLAASAGHKEVSSLLELEEKEKKAAALLRQAEEDAGLSPGAGLGKPDEKLASTLASIHAAQVGKDPHAAAEAARKAAQRGEFPDFGQSKAKAVESCARPGCNNTTKLQKCTRCWKVSYCGRACQRHHWKAHKQYCKAPVREVDEEVAVDEKAKAEEEVDEKAKAEEEVDEKAKAEEEVDEKAKAEEEVDEKAKAEDQE